MIIILLLFLVYAHRKIDQATLSRGSELIPQVILLCNDSNRIQQIPTLYKGSPM